VIGAAGRIGWVAGDVENGAFDGDEGGSRRVGSYHGICRQYRSIWHPGRMGEWDWMVGGKASRVKGREEAREGQPTVTLAQLLVRDRIVLWRGKLDRCLGREALGLWFVLLRLLLGVRRICQCLRLFGHFGGRRREGRRLLVVGRICGENVDYA
jgi:hypothetical protein